jgi:hypothetical protein
MVDKVLSKLDQLKALQAARMERRSNPFEDAARGRDPVPKSSGGGMEGHASTPSRSSDMDGLTARDGRAVKGAGIKPSPPEAKKQRAKRGTFDRNAYQRDYMRKRRQTQKKEPKG